MTIWISHLPYSIGGLIFTLRTKYMLTSPITPHLIEHYSPYRTEKLFFILAVPAAVVAKAAVEGAVAAAIVAWKWLRWRGVCHKSK